MASGKIYQSPILLAVMATVTILIGSVVTMAYPMLNADMHPKEFSRPLTPLQLAGRDVYQREGCVGCHTQMIRPLPSEVKRYGEFSKAGEFAYEHPFLWGSKRTGPDLAREGVRGESGVKNADWHQAHFINAQALVPGSNMPSYAFLKGRLLDPAEVLSHLGALAVMHDDYRSDLPTVQKALIVKDARTGVERPADELDALVAYMLQLGTGTQPPKVEKAQGAQAIQIDLAQVNPVAGDKAAKLRGHKLFLDNCAACHGPEAEGTESGPSLIDDRFLGADGDLPDAAYRAMIKYGSEARPALGRTTNKKDEMPGLGDDLKDVDAWSIVAWLRAQKAHEKLEGEIK
jgi:cytochrome c oxidase cbb3-type subunit 2